MLDIDVYEILAVNLPACYLLTVVGAKYVNVCVEMLSVCIGSGHNINR